MNNTGFTLVELMVAITISMVLAGVGIVSYNRYDMREKTNQTASEVVSYINLARSMAMTNQKTDGFSAGLDYVSVVLRDGTISAFPVNISSGTGPSYFSKVITDNGTTITQLDFGDLQFGTTTGKLLLKEADPSFNVYPPPASGVGVSLTVVSGADSDDKKKIVVSPIGIVKLSEGD